MVVVTDGLGLDEDMATTEEGVMMVILGVLSPFVSWVVVVTANIDFGLNVGAVRISMRSGCCRSELLEAAAEAAVCGSESKKAVSVMYQRCDERGLIINLVLDLSLEGVYLVELAAEAVEAAVLVSKKQRGHCYRKLF